MPIRSATFDGPIGRRTIPILALLAIMAGCNASAGSGAVVPSDGSAPATTSTTEGSTTPAPIPIADLTDFVVPFEYTIPVGSDIRRAGGAGASMVSFGSALVSFVSGPAQPVDQIAEDDNSGQEPKAWEARGVVVGSAEEAWSHGRAGRFMLETEATAFLAGLRDNADVRMGSIEQATLDGHPALTTLLPGTGGSDIHVTGHMQGLSGDFVLVTMPSRLTVADIDGSSVFVLTWARTADGLTDWLPTADRLIDSFHFVPEVQS